MQNNAHEIAYTEQGHLGDTFRGDNGLKGATDEKGLLTAGTVQDLSLIFYFTWKFEDLSAAQVINAILITFFHQTIVKLELSNLVIRKTISNELFLYRLYIAISGARSPLEPYQIYEPEA